MSDSLAGPAEGQAEPTQEVEVEAAAVAALRVLSTETNTLRSLKIKSFFSPCVSHCCDKSDQAAVNVAREGKGLSLCDCDCAMDRADCTCTVCIGGAPSLGDLTGDHDSYSDRINVLCHHRIMLYLVLKYVMSELNVTRAIILIYIHLCCLPPAVSAALQAGSRHVVACPAVDRAPGLALGDEDSLQPPPELEVTSPGLSVGHT